MELADGRVDAVYARVVIDRERLVVRHWERDSRRIGFDKVGIGIDGLSELEDVLVEERHFDGRMGIVEVDRGLQRPVRHRYGDAGSEVLRHIELEVVKQHQELAVTWRESEASRIEVDHGGTCRTQRRYCRLEGIEHGLRRRDVFESV